MASIHSLRNVILLVAWLLLHLGSICTAAQPEPSIGSVAAVPSPARQDWSALPRASVSPLGAFSVRFGPGAQTVLPVIGTSSATSTAQSGMASMMSGLQSQAAVMHSMGAQIMPNETGLEQNHINQNQFATINAELEGALNNMQDA
jgi:hypothetical protein